MNGKLLVLILFCTITSTFAQRVRISFGSCSRENLEEQLWSDIIATQPDIWIWGGDNIYGDSHDLSVLQAKYEKQKGNTEYQQLLETCPVTGTWDDHDYGHNDGGKHFSKRNESKTLAANFLGFAPDHEVWKHEGLYNSTLLKKGKRQIKIINLDTRFFRDTIYKEYYVDTLTNRRTYRFLPNSEGDMLGEQQWSWLEEELKAPADLFVINSSIQVISEEHRFEKWGNLPKAQERLYALLQKYPDKKTIIISGDRHIAELSKRTFTSLPYPLFDFTASGLTHTWSESWEETNSFRQGELIIEKNFGIIDLEFKKSAIHVRFLVKGKNGVVFLDQATTL